MELDPRIGSGVTAAVYALGDGRVLKLFEEEIAHETVRRAVDRAVRTLFERVYRRQYRAATGVTAAAIRAWELPIAAARLVEDAADERLREWVGRRLQHEGIAAFSIAGR